MYINLIYCHNAIYIKDILSSIIARNVVFSFRIDMFMEWCIIDVQFPSGCQFGLHYVYIWKTYTSLFKIHISCPPCYDQLNMFW